jgi:hypothetical protein
VLAIKVVFVVVVMQAPKQSKLLAVAEWPWLA